MSQASVTDSSALVAAYILQASDPSLRIREMADSHALVKALDPKAELSSSQMAEVASAVATGGMRPSELGLKCRMLVQLVLEKERVVLEEVVNELRQEAGL